MFWMFQLTFVFRRLLEIELSTQMWSSAQQLLKELKPMLLHWKVSHTAHLLLPLWAFLSFQIKNLKEENLKKLSALKWPFVSTSSITYWSNWGHVSTWKYWRGCGGRQRLLPCTSPALAVPSLPCVLLHSAVSVSKETHWGFSVPVTSGQNNSGKT